jgi:hypothetical protein
MIIAATTDQGLIEAFRKIYNGSWGQIAAIDPKLGQDKADEEMKELLSLLGPDEPLCFLAHGNDKEMGDDGGPTSKWDWHHEKLAKIFVDGVPATWNQPVLFAICCNSVANYSAHVAVDLGKKKRIGIWCYGYNRPTGYGEKIPEPQNVDKDRSLQGTQS